MRVVRQRHWNYVMFLQVSEFIFDRCSLEVFRTTTSWSSRIASCPMCSRLWMEQMMPRWLGEKFHLIYSNSSSMVHFEWHEGLIGGRIRVYLQLPARRLGHSLRDQWDESGQAGLVPERTQPRWGLFGGKVITHCFADFRRTRHLR